MKTLLVAATLLLSTVSSAGLLGSAYISGSVLGNQGESKGLSINSVLNGDVDFKKDGSLAFAIGVGSGLTRFEAELLTKRSNFENNSANLEELKSSSVMANYYLDLPSWGRPYIGGGVGMEFAKLNLTGSNEMENSKLAYQFMSGFRFKLLPMTTGKIGYRYYNCSKLNFADQSGSTVIAFDHKENMLELGVSIGF
jgi:opacity protein-like surface antigen